MQRRSVGHRNFLAKDFDKRIAISIRKVIRREINQLNELTGEMFVPSQGITIVS